MYLSDIKYYRAVTPEEIMLQENAQYYFPDYCDFWTVYMKYVVTVCKYVVS